MGFELLREDIVWSWGSLVQPHHLTSKPRGFFLCLRADFLHLWSHGHWVLYGWTVTPFPISTILRCWVTLMTISCLCEWAPDMNSTEWNFQIKQMESHYRLWRKYLTFLDLVLLVVKQRVYLGCPAGVFHFGGSLGFRTSCLQGLWQKWWPRPCDLPTYTMSLSVGHHSQLGAKIGSVYSQQSRTWRDKSKGQAWSHLSSSSIFVVLTSLKVAALQAPWGGNVQRFAFIYRTEENKGVHVLKLDMGNIRMRGVRTLKRCLAYWHETSACFIGTLTKIKAIW